MNYFTQRFPTPYKERATSLFPKMRPVTASTHHNGVSRGVPATTPGPNGTTHILRTYEQSLSASLENQLEAFLDGTLPSANEIAPLQSSSEDKRALP